MLPRTIKATVNNNGGLDLGKLVFGGIFLGGILRGKIPHAILVMGGFAVATAFCIVGLFLGTREKKN